MVIGLVSGGGEEAPASTAAASTTTAPGPPAKQPLTPVGTVARRVERIRDLRYRHIPRAHAVTPAQAARAGLADLDRTYPAAQRHADEALLETLGAVPPRTDLRREIGAEFRDEVGGYYDPRTKRLAVVKGAATGGALGDIVLAHELNHALEDQRFGLHDSGSSAAIDDASLANTALVEGSATAVMYDYAQRFLDPGQALGDLLPALQASGSAHLPRYLEDSLTWPYEGGLSFVNRLYARLHGWGLVNYALRRRRPATTEQVLHPDKYLTDERPLPVRAPPEPGPGLAARRPRDAGRVRHPRAPAHRRRGGRRRRGRGVGRRPLRAVVARRPPRVGAELALGHAPRRAPGGRRPRDLPHLRGPPRAGRAGRGGRRDGARLRAFAAARPKPRHR